MTKTFKAWVRRKNMTKTFQDLVGQKKNHDICMTEQARCENTTREFSEARSRKTNRVGVSDRYENPF